jgi:cytochrome c peroxidase
MDASAGGTSGSGGTSGTSGSGGVPDASTSGGTTSSGGTSSGGSGAGGSKDAGPESGEAGDPCANFRCQEPYPPVAYPAANGQLDSKAMLGKILFWDEQMGQLDNMACGTCHRIQSGGSDSRTNDPAAHLPGPNGVFETEPDITSDDIRGAQGVPKCNHDGSLTTPGDSTVQVTTRKPPTYLDAMFAGQVFWDGHAGYCKNGEGPGGCFYDPDLATTAAPLIVGTFDQTTGRIIGAALEDQASHPPIGTAEMACQGRTWADIEAKLSQTTLKPLNKATAVPFDMLNFISQYKSYPAMFQAVYGSTDKVNITDPDNVVNARRILFALATHERRLTSDLTPWDCWTQADKAPPECASVPAMTPAQIHGWTVFVGAGHCASCHSPPLFTDNKFHFIGFHEPSWDTGLQMTTGQSTDVAKFKTANLRNVGLREQYGLLHEGEGPGHDLNTIMTLYISGGRRDTADIVGLIDPIIVPLSLTQTDVTDILDFMRNALTDVRVKKGCPPFDRPYLSTETPPTTTPTCP